MNIPSIETENIYSSSVDTEAVISPFDYREHCRNLSDELANLENKFNDKVAENGRNSGLLARAKNNIFMFEDRLKDAILNEDIDTDLAQEFADIFSFTFTREVEVFFTVAFRGYAQVPLTQDIEEIDWENEVEFDCNTYQSEIEFDLHEDVISVEVS
jgi:hypothetical protein